MFLCIFIFPSVLFFAMSEHEENQQYQQSQGLPAPGYEASQEERHSPEIEEERNTSVPKREEEDSNSFSLLTLAR